MPRKTLKEHFKDANSNTFVNLIYDEWESPNSTKRTQRYIKSVPLETLVREYGDWEYDSAYTILRTKERIEIDVWASAIDERKYSEEYRNATNENRNEYVKTNMGLVPLEDYYDICSRQMGFDSYEDLRDNGYSIDKPETITIEEGGEESLDL